MLKKTLAMGAAAATLMLTAIPASAAWYIDDDGNGFVGKGDVQLIYGWNNKQLQNNASIVDFQVSMETVTEVSWVCTNSNNDSIQERERTTTTTLEGLVTTVARERNQVTGFLLTGFDGDATSSDPTTEGPKLDSCPSGPWTLTTPAGDPELVSQTGGLQVTINGTDWYDVPAPTL